MEIVFPTYLLEIIYGAGNSMDLWKVVDLIYIIGVFQALELFFKIYGRRRSCPLHCHRMHAV